MNAGDEVGRPAPGGKARILGAFATPGPPGEPQDFDTRPEAHAVSARVLPFRQRGERAGERLCERGFHHWEIAIPGPYQAVGRTPILWRCKRCGAGCEGPTPGAWPGERRPSHRRGG